jgi:hypothetical protein
MSGYDEDLEVLLQGFGDRILEYTKTLRDQVDTAEAREYAAEDRLGALKWHGERDRQRIKDLKVILFKSERGRLPESEAMALIRGLLHE